MSELNKDGIELLLQTGRAQQEVNENLNGDPFAITPAGVPVNLSHLYAPRRIKQTVLLSDVGSFVDYVNRFKTEHTLIFAQIAESSATFEAVIDYHESIGAPDYCQHRARFTTVPTPEWATWLKANRLPMNQVEFATWLEDNLSLFVQPIDPATGKPAKDVPSGAELLELVQTLHGHQNARFNTSLRLHNGAYSVNYDEDVDVKGQVGGGTIELPKSICGGFPIFQGGDPFEIPARLKVRVTERKMVLFFETIGIPQLIRDNLIGDVEHPGVVRQIEGMTEITPLLGSV